MVISVFELFKIGIGPSSSHTVGPMRAARQFVVELQDKGLLSQTQTVKVELFGSLGATGKGHGSDKAVLLGLEGEIPDQIDPAIIDACLTRIRTQGQLFLLGQHPIHFSESEHLHFYWKALPFHPNGIRFYAFNTANEELQSATYYSIGGGFIVQEETRSQPAPTKLISVPYPFCSAAQLLEFCQTHHLSISQLIWANETCWRSETDIRQGLLHIWDVMQACVHNGCHHEGILPGSLKVKRRAPELYRQLVSQVESSPTDSLSILDWVNLYAIAVNEENAAGGRVVTAPTNGAAGIIPAVLHYFARFCPHSNPEQIIKFFLTAGAIGTLYKENASISGADVGCQGEVGVACSMAAGALAEVLGGTPQQVENAAEIAMEHHLGMTCDPVGGLVQIPCIERNAMGAVKAINAARIALRGDGRHFVSLDKVIKTMRMTGADMHSKYKETARGGLAVNVIEC
ncbi:L-serine ammonia-lyase [Leptolyngbya sp. FACHB-261]|uniref:L-serine ammonia-lyase n=1 Tax=Leptolyngbya sp. FACHB-261 TaxID=2692806 RepID=UPI001684AE16|nr:L-serine ammonia-lyase [Leptolyngbya sp. FACHB-261]MBD2099299.1 L-serine ammonia-lyase [Leptolyngbya sp. FACHB-261]